MSTTDINTFDVVVELQHSVPGAASAAVVRFSNGREAVWLTVDGEVHKGALSAAASLRHSTVTLNCPSLVFMKELL